MTDRIELDGGNVVLIRADVMDGLRQLPDNSVHLVCTSPPYWALRQYFFDKAVVLRYSLTNEQKQNIEAELARRGIRPRQ
jgi:DNA modification methylase